MAMRKKPVGRPRKAANPKLDQAVAHLGGEVIHANLSDIFLILQKMEQRLEWLNERDNVNSFALAVPASAGPPGPQSPTPYPADETILARLDRLEIAVADLDFRQNVAYERIGAMENLVGTRTAGAAEPSAKAGRKI